MFKDYYFLLDIPENASLEKIKKAYREQAIKWHPDHNPGQDTTARMQDIIEAYCILKDQEARLKYDLEYNNYKEYNTLKKDHFKKTESGFSDKKNDQNQSYYSDYNAQDDLLKKWMENAKRQAANLVHQVIIDFKGVSTAAGEGILQGTIGYVLCGIIAYLIFSMKHCK